MTASDWPGPGAMRVGLGCMRLAGAGDELAGATIAAAVEAGVRIFDTAHSYGPGADQPGHNERLVASALRGCGAIERARIVTKGGMTRAGLLWLPDGRRRVIQADCEASLAALDGLPIDLYLLHAPDPRTPWRTSVRALAQLVDQGLVRRVGLSNVNRGQLDEAIDLAPVAAVQVAVSWFDDTAIRGGVLERCQEQGIAVIAHSPLGGPRRAARLAREVVLGGVAAASGATPAEVALAWLLQLSPVIVPIPGARRPETARSLARAADLRLGPPARRALARPAPTSPRVRGARVHGAEVVMVMGIPGAGKTTVAREYAGRGYLRLNRDERGGSLRDVVAGLDRALSEGAQRVVVDNTYLGRAARSHVLEAARRHGLVTRCLWIDTPLAQAQVNMVERLLDRFGTLPTPEELRAAARREPGLLSPTSQMRAFRELEEPSTDEGFVAVDRVPFVRRDGAPGSRPGVFVAAAALDRSGWERAVASGDPAAPHLLFDWRPGGTIDSLADAAVRLAGVVSGPVESALCAHAGGPPTCWCRPPLPGLPLAFARRHGIDLARSTLVGGGPAHRTLANTLGARHVAT